jgi:hypothetical protein
MRPGLKVHSLIKHLGLSVSEAAPIMDVGRSAIDSWKSVESARPSVDSALKLWRHARKHGVEIPFHWFWDEDSGSLQSVILESQASYSTGSSRAHWLKSVRGLVQVIVSLGSIIKLTHPRALGEILPFLSFAQLELDSIQSSQGLTESEEQVVLVMATQLATFISSCHDPTAVKQ